MAKLRLALIYLFGSQILLAVLILSSFLSDATLSDHVTTFGMPVVIAGAMALEICGVALVFLMRKDFQRIRDERENFIDLRSYRLSFQIQSLALIGLIIGNSLLPARSPMLVVVLVIVIANISRALAYEYFKRVT